MNLVCYNSSKLLPNDNYFQGYNWSSIKPGHGCSYHDTSTYMLDSWKYTIMIMRLMQMSSKRVPHMREKYERRFGASLISRGKTPSSACCRWNGIQGGSLAVSKCQEYNFKKLFSKEEYIGRAENRQDH
ncbi:hypothetical protein TNCV_3273731 [Trichonephila clavipes]|nr:hypothetical protein TNCV_3273731 [Trichonephila clavipes]